MKHTSISFFYVPPFKALFQIILFIVFATSSTLTYSSISKDIDDAINAEKYPTAIILLKNQIQESPESIEPRIKLGELYLSLGKFEQSVSELKRAYDNEPNNSKALFSYSDALIKTGEFKAAQLILEMELKNIGDEYKRQYYLGYAVLGQDEKIVAKKYFNESNKLSENIDAYNGLLRIALVEKNFSEIDKLLSTSFIINNSGDETKQLNAKALYLQGQYKDAYKIYNALVLKNKTVMVFRFERALTLFKLKKNKQALSDIDFFIAKVDRFPDAFLLKSQIHLEEKNYAEAIDSGNKVLDLNPNLKAVNYILGLSHFQLKNYFQSEKYMRAVTNIEPSFIEPKIILADIEIIKNNEKNALASLDIMTSQGELSTSNAISIAALYLKLKKPQMAISILLEAQSRDENNVGIKQLLVDAMLNASEYKNAITVLKELLVLSSDPKQIKNINNLLITNHIKAKELEPAEQLVDKALIEEPKDLKLLSLKALVLRLKGQFDESKAVYINILSIDNKNVSSYLGLARIGIEKKQWAVAEQHLKNLFELIPQLLEPYLQLAKVLEKQNKRKEAQVIYVNLEKRLLGIESKNPKNAHIVYILALLYEQRNHVLKAIDQYEKALNIYSQDTYALRKLSMLNINRDLKQSLFYINKAYKANPKDIEISSYYGFILAKSGEQKKSVDLLVKLAEENPNDNNVLYYLAFSLNEAGNKTKAMDQLSKINMKADFTEKKSVQDLKNRLTN